MQDQTNNEVFSTRSLALKKAVQEKKKVTRRLKAF